MQLSERIQKHFNEHLDLYIDVDLAPDGDNEAGLIESVQQLEQENAELHRKLNLIHDKTLALDLVLTQLRNKLNVTE